MKVRAKYEIALFRRMRQNGCDKNRDAGAPSDICPIGLEQQLISSEYTKKRAITKRLVTLAVLSEQARSVSAGEADGTRWERIAAASRQHSEWSRLQARTIGYFQDSHVC